MEAVPVLENQTDQKSLHYCVAKDNPKKVCFPLGLFFPTLPDCINEKKQKVKSKVKKKKRVGFEVIYGTHCKPQWDAIIIY